jgi:hypothetical protein
MCLRLATLGAHMQVVGRPGTVSQVVGLGVLHALPPCEAPPLLRHGLGSFGKLTHPQAVRLLKGCICPTFICFCSPGPLGLRTETCSLRLPLPPQAQLPMDESHTPTPTSPTFCHTLDHQLTKQFSAHYISTTGKVPAPPTPPQHPLAMQLVPAPITAVQYLCIRLPLNPPETNKVCKLRETPPQG